MLQNKQSNKFVNVLGVVLIILAVALTYASNLIDVEAIVKPFEDLVQGTFIEEYIDEAKERDFERSMNDTDTPAQLIAQNIKELTGLTSAQQYYIKYQGFMEKFENSIALIPNKFIIVITILLLFALKSIVAFLPASFTCLVTALIFPFRTAMIINMCGYCLMFTCKYLWGKYIGEGNVSKLVKKTKHLWRFIKDEENNDGKGNPLVLFILRLVPTVPLNPISQMYGKMGYDYKKYLLLSALGISLRVVSVTSLGSNVDDPFSSAFVVPLIVILFVSGFSMIALSIILKKKAENAPPIDDDEFGFFDS